MQVGLAQCVNKGMQRDYSMDKASQEFAYENRNIRITTTGSNSFLSITNEKSTTEVSISFNNDTGFHEDFIILGSTTIEDTLILFGTANNTDNDAEDLDYIYKIYDINSSTNECQCFLLYKGNLGFRVNNPIECLGILEGDDVKKVYWVDGKNQPRYINIEVDNTYPEDETFYFKPYIKSAIDVDITKEYLGTGEFTSGVIQYYITGYKKYGAESNILYVSPLYYVSPKGRGGEIDEKNTCSFRIKVTNFNDFEGIKVYSMFRSSYNIEPAVKLVYESIVDSPTINMIDENKGIPQSATDILFLNTETIVASTIETKDNTLFLGDIKTENLTEDFINDANSILENYAGEYSFIYRPLGIHGSENPLYNYSSNLDDPSSLTRYFKPREYYRVGTQFKTVTGNWSSIFDVQDIQCDLNIKYEINESDKLISDSEYLITGDSEIVYVPMLYRRLDYNDEFKKFIDKYNIIEWRLVVAEHTDSTRTIKAQGLLLPTIFNLAERYKENCYYTSLWNMGMAQSALHNVNIEQLTKDTVDGEDVYRYSDTPFNIIDKSYYNTDGLLKSVYDNKEGSNNSGTIFIYSIQCKVEGDRALSITTQDTVNVFLSITIEEESSGTRYKSEFFRIANAHRAFGQGKKTCKDAFNKATGVFWKDIINTVLRFDNYSSVAISDIEGIDKNEKVFRESELPSSNEIIKTFVPFAHNTRRRITTEEYGRNISYDANTNLIDIHKNEYFIDANVCDFYSPEAINVEDGLNFRLVGSTDILNSISDYKVKVDNSVDSQGYIIEAAKYVFNTYRINNLFTGITSFPLWPYDNKMFWVYYWQHSGSISASDDAPNSDSVGVFNLKSKVFANMWYCDKTTFVEAPYIYNVASSEYKTEETSLYQGFIYKNKYENILIKRLDDLHYIDSANETSSMDALVSEPTYAISASSKLKTLSINSDSTAHCVVDLGNQGPAQNILPNYSYNETTNSLIYENFVRDNPSVWSSNISDFLISKNWILEIVSSGEVFRNSITTLEAMLQIVGTSGFYYQASPEEIILENNRFRLTIKDISTKVSGEGTNRAYVIVFVGATTSLKILWIASGVGSNILKYTRDPIIVSTTGNQKVIEEGLGLFKVRESLHTVSPKLGTTSKYWIGEFYSDYDETTFMGGNTEAAIQANVFLPVYGKYNLPQKVDENEIHGEGYGLEGDTYYQRWDYLRIKPTSEDAANQPIDAFSIMVETYKNLDGDFRKLRGRLDVTNLTEDNTNNVLNEVYSQHNNYLTYNVLAEKFNDSYHPSLYTWSLTKQPLSTIDVWTKINLSSSNSLDETKGKLTKIKNYNDVLYAFQEKAIATINFNKQTTISTSDGTPVEIANSGKVTGHYYIDTNQGCKNKWSIAESPYGLYFIDSYNKSISSVRTGVQSLSTIHLFEDWIVNNEKDVVWNPLSTNEGFKSFYDPIHKEVYFVNNKEALCYNELLSQFSSFYDYGNLNTMVNINGHIYGIKDANIHKMFEGRDYCNLFGEQKEYSMVYKINKDPFVDKTWTNVEYRADIFDVNKLREDIPYTDYKEQTKIINDTFDTLEVWNEYQRGTAYLTEGKYPKVRNKFRVWRADIPRDTEEGKPLNRIRNPWIMLKLTKNSENSSNRMEFHDLLIKYLQ